MSRKIMTEEKIQKLKELANNKMLVIDIAPALNVSRETVKAWAKKFNIKICSKEEHFNSKYQKALDLYKSGSTIKELRRMGYCRERLKKEVESAGLQWRDADARGQERRLSEEEVLVRLPKDQKYTYLGFKNGKYQFRDEKGNLFGKKADRIQQGSPYGKPGRKMSNEEFLERLLETGYKIISVDASNRCGPMIVECKNGHRRPIKQARSLIYNEFTDCDQCSDRGKSKEELELLTWVKSYFPDAQSSFKLNKEKKSTPGPKKEIDILIESKKIGIEYCGLFDHCEKRKPRKRAHKEKREIAERAGITLFHVYSDEFKNKEDILKSVLLTKFGLITNTLHARKLTIKNVSRPDAAAFFDKNHLMGSFLVAKNIGLYDGDELVSLISYKKHKKGVDIARFANKIGLIVNGGLSRLLKEIERRESPEFIQSWVDLRYGTGASLKSIGFKSVKTTLGWKWTAGNRTFNRSYCRANMDDRKLPEAEHAKELKLYKIYDAGQRLFRKQLRNSRCLS